MSSNGLSNTPIDPLAGIDPSTPQDRQREHVATLVKGDAVSVDQANVALRARGYAELNTNSAEYAQAQKDALLRDTDFMARYSRNDPSAVAELYRADVRLHNSSGRLIDRNPSAADQQYDQMKNEVYRQIPGPNSDTYATELAGVAASIGMAGPNAKSLVEDHFAAIRETAGMDQDQANYWSEREFSTFHSALGDNAEQKLAEASKILSQMSGRKLDLGAIAKTNGARVAINLYFQSQAIKGAK